MKKQKNQSSILLNLIPKMAKKVGEHSVDAACVWWLCQPKVPEGMKNTHEKHSK